MSDEDRAPRPRYGHGLGENAEPTPSTSINDGTPWLTAHQPDTNYVGADHGPNYAVYGRHRYDPYHDNLWHGPEGPPSAVNLERQYAYQTNPNIDYLTPGNAQHLLVPPGPSHNIPPAHDIPNGVVRDRSAPLPDVTDTFSRSVPESVSSGVSAKECLKRLADRYLNDPGSQVDTLRMGLTPSGGRLRVMIVLDIDI